MHFKGLYIQLCKSEQHECNFEVEIFKCNFWIELYSLSIHILLKVIPKGPIYNKAPLV